MSPVIAAEILVFRPHLCQDNSKTLTDPGCFCAV